jgi:hypothetical protein
MNGFELSVGLDDEQIEALCTYVRSSRGNQASAVSATAGLEAALNLVR